MELFPSLEISSINSLVTQLWTLPDVISEIRKLTWFGSLNMRNLHNEYEVDTGEYWDSIDLYRKWEKLVEQLVSEKVDSLPLPKSLANRLQEVVKPIGLQLLEWADFYRQEVFLETDCLVSDYLNLISWTHNGTIDYRQTAIKFLSLPELSLSKRFELACTCCCENQILPLFRQLPFDEDFYTINYYDLYVENRTLLYWTCFVQKKMADLIDWRAHDDEGDEDGCLSLFESLLGWAVRRGTVSAVHFFWKKLSEEEGGGARECLPEFARRAAEHRRGSILYFLLSKMSSDQCHNALAEDGSELLSALAQDRLWNRLFIPLARPVMQQLTSDGFDLLLKKLASRMNPLSTPQGKQYQRLYKDFWASSPDNLKELVFENGHFPIVQLIQAGDEDTIAQATKQAGQAAKDRFLSINYWKIEFLICGGWEKGTRTFLKEILPAETIDAFLEKICLEAEKPNGEPPYWLGREII